MTVRLLAVLTLVATLSAQAPQPTFANGDLADLSCRVTAVETIDKYARVLTIEVHNAGAVAAEPLVFELTWTHSKKGPTETQIAARAQLPRVARYGNPTPAGGIQRYLVRTHLPFKRGKGSVAVSEASFYRGGVTPAPKLKIDKPQLVQRESFVGRFPVTQVTLHNPLPHALDVLLRVKLSQPTNCTELMGVRLPANDSFDWVLTTRPGRSMFVEPDTPPASSVKAVKFEVVDWCLVGDEDPEAAAALLRPAYEAWYRWPGRDITVSGEFSFRERTQRTAGQKARGNAGQYDDQSSQGRFTITSAGNVRIAFTSGEAANPGLVLATAFADFVRPDFAALANENRLQRIASDRVALVGDGWDPTRGPQRTVTTMGSADRPELHEDLTVADGRVVSSGRGEGGRTNWRHRQFGRHYVISQRFDGSTRTSYGHAEEDGRIVPNIVTSQTRFGDTLFRSNELVLTELNFEGTVEVQPVAPTGPGVSALRAMWDAGWALSSEPLEIEARFEVETSSDLLWQGEETLRGKVSMRGIGRHLRSAEFAFDGKRTAGKELALAAVIRDRWLMWYSRDFNTRPLFDQFFRGATIGAANAAGEFEIENCAVDRVRTSGGVIEGLVRPGGGTVRFVRHKIGDRKVVGRIIETHDGWTSTTRLKWQQVGDHLLPTMLKFENIFSWDWGPETITFKNWKVR